MVNLLRFRPFRALLVLVALLVACSAFVSGCGPIVPPPTQHFVAVVENVATAPEQIELRWAIGGIYVGSETRIVPALGSTTIVMGDAAPDLVEIHSTPLTTAWGPPDWSKGPVFHIVCPTAFVWSGPF